MSTQHRWRIVMVQETGERVQYGDKTFDSTEAASRYIDRERLDDLYPESHIYIEPDILAVGHLWGI